MASDLFIFLEFYQNIILQKMWISKLQSYMPLYVDPIWWSQKFKEATFAIKAELEIPL